MGGGGGGGERGGRGGGGHDPVSFLVSLLKQWVAVFAEYRNKNTNINI